MVHNESQWEVNGVMDSEGNRRRKAVFASGIHDSPLVTFVYSHTLQLIDILSNTIYMRDCTSDQ